MLSVECEEYMGMKGKSKVKIHKSTRCYPNANKGVLTLPKMKTRMDPAGTLISVSHT